MQEATIPVNAEKLQTLSKLHKGSRIAERLGISKQRWQHYKTGTHDVPESIISALCVIYGLERSELVLTEGERRVNDKVKRQVEIA